MNNALCYTALPESEGGAADQDGIAENRRMIEIDEFDKDLLAMHGGCLCGITRSVLDRETDKITYLGHFRCPIHSSVSESDLKSQSESSLPDRLV